MIFPYVVAGIVGFLQTLFIVSQTRLVAAGRKGWPVFGVSLCIGTVWVVGVRSAVHSPWTAATYVLFAAAGSATAASLRLGGLRPRRHLLPRSLRKQP